MFTTVDKAIAAVLGGVITVLGMVFNVEIGLSPEVIGSLGSLLAGLLVWAVPNKEATE